MINFSIENFIIGFLGTILGVWIIKEAFYINHHLLFAGWIENKYGPGTGTLFYRLVGLGLCIFFVFVMLGYINVINTPGSRTGSSSSSLPSTQTTPANSRF